MNIQVSAKTFTSAAEQMAHASAVRKRLFSGKRKPAVTVIALQEPQSVMASQIPLWQRRDIAFDAHIQLYQHIQTIQGFSVRATFKRHQGDWASEPRKSIEDIVREVLRGFPGVTVADVRGRRRAQAVNAPRQLAIYEVHRQRKDLSTPQIGNWFGKRDHTTILHSVWKMEKVHGPSRSAAALSEEVAG